MTVWDVLIALVALTLGVGGTVVATRRRHGAAEPATSPAKILFPFVGSELSERALQATLRLAWAEHVTVVPGYLTTVPLPLALDAPVGRRCDEAFDVFEAIELKAAPVGMPVDGRIARGRNVRHALRELIDDVPTATRIVVATASNGTHDGFSVDDIAWLLRNAPGEVVVIRPTHKAAPTRQRTSKKGSPAGSVGRSHRPGRVGQRPPSDSIARAIAAWGE